MDAKAYLRQIRSCDAVIRYNLAALRQLHEDAYGVSAPSGDGIRGGGTSGSAVENKAIKLADAEAEYEDEVTRAARLKAKIIGQVAAMPDDKCRDVLSMVYIEGKDLQDVADEMGYTYWHVTHLHGNALDRFRQMYLQ